MTDDPKLPAVVAEFRNEIEAMPLLSALEEAGIQASKTGAYTTSIWSEAIGSVQVVVKQENLAQAEQIWEDIQQNPQPFDWSQVESDEIEPEE